MFDGWEKFRKEKDIVRILRSLRYLKIAVRYLIRDPSKRKELKIKSQFKLIESFKKEKGVKIFPPADPS